MKHKKDINNMTEKELLSYYHHLGKKNLSTTNKFFQVKLLLHIKYGLKATWLKRYNRTS